jgi:microcystin-dependent protein
VSSPFVAEIRIFGFQFAPTGWAFTNGQLLPISQNTALFSLLGTFYGGDGKSTFALPNLQGSVALNQGQSTTGSQYFIGQQSGAQFVTLLQSEIPVHTHQIMTDPDDAPESNDPTGLAMTRGSKFVYGAPAAMQPMAFQALSVAGGSLPHNNMMPYLTTNFCIALQGVFPARN